MASQKTPREEGLALASDCIARGLGSMLRWSGYQGQYEQAYFDEGCEMLARGIFQALSLLRGEQEDGELRALVDTIAEDMACCIPGLPYRGGTYQAMARRLEPALRPILQGKREAERQLGLLKESFAEELGCNLRIAERIGIAEAIEAGKAYEDAEVEMFDSLRAQLASANARAEEWEQKLSSMIHEGDEEASRVRAALGISEDGRSLEEQVVAHGRAANARVEELSSELEALRAKCRS